MGHSARVNCHTPPLRVRSVGAGDAGEAARLMAEAMPLPLRLRAGLAPLLHRLLGAEALTGVCVEAAPSFAANGRNGRELLGLGLSGFLSDAAADVLIERPAARYALELLDRCLDDERCCGLLDAASIALANAGGGLNLLPLFWLQRAVDTNSPLGAELAAIGMESFLGQHRGYNLKRIIKETSAEEAARFEAAGMRTVKRFDSPSGEPVVLALTREEAQASGYGSALGLLFASRRPRLGFSRIQQQVLERAVDDLADEEIAEHLCLSPHAVNMRWPTIYDRVDSHPDLAAAIFYGHDRSNGEAGGHKRRRIVAFVRAHPEELRPFAGGRERNDRGEGDRRPR